MMAWVHATVGAALGSQARNSPLAYAAGAASHLVCDLFPHRDFEMPVEMPLLAIALGLIAWRYGARSPQMAGALGAISPDFENGFMRLGLTKGMLYPTHTARWWFVGHGRAIRSPLNQIVLAALCIAALEMSRRSI